MKELIFATNNPDKLREIQDLLGDGFKLYSLKDMNFSGDIPETGDTLEKNASQKANFIYGHFNRDVFADDTGLEIDALGGKPGVLSARYAGPDKDPEANIKRVIHELKYTSNRKARFRTIITLIVNGKEFSFEGTVEGKILKLLRGKKGFGYDPLFQPSGYTKTFAEMELKQKNLISHRAIAFNKLIGFLKKGIYTIN
ncbi:MAG: RdgB/HAM1 family non-canonical purine NTP pyrophosphatase [Bacteroidetes bacterium]|nr:RdgB/HAM1 family non-canonical purine NTP pyrophosphatase [Bacteroidota bacterium]